VQKFIAAGDAVVFTQRRQIADLALSNRLPSMFLQREYAAAGGLMSYGENLSEDFQRRQTRRPADRATHAEMPL
jgi:hypothetical protein